MPGILNCKSMNLFACPDVTLLYQKMCFFRSRFVRVKYRLGFSMEMEGLVFQVVPQCRQGGNIWLIPSLNCTTQRGQQPQLSSWDFSGSSNILLPKQETFLNQDQTPVTLKESVGRHKTDPLNQTDLLNEKGNKTPLCYIHPCIDFQAPGVLSSDFLDHYLCWGFVPLCGSADRADK